MSGARKAPLVLERTAAARDAARARVLDATPSWYRPWAHLATTVGISLAALVLALRALDHPKPLEWLVVVVALVLGNLLEYRVHKYVLHRRRFPTQVLYDRHTPQHHAIYMNGDMAIRSTREFRLVLIPAFGVAMLVLGTLPFAAAFGYVFGHNVGCLFVATSAFILGSYETLHLSYHLSPESFVGRMRVIQLLRRHHSLHHDPRLMHKWNFNVTVPLFDWVLGTTYDESRGPALSVEASKKTAH